MPMRNEPDLTREIVYEFLECLDEGIHIVNADGITVFYNRVASRLDGLSIKEVMGMHVLDAFPSLTKKTSTLLKVLKTGEPIAEQHQTYMNRKGKQISTINRTIPLRSEGKIVGAAEISKDITQIKELAEQVLQLQERIREPRSRKAQKESAYYCFEQIVTQNSLMLREIEKAKRAARTDSPVLVVGETGTGKELFVQSIHRDSPRMGRPFIAQNCAAIPSTLLEGILFGTAKGAFTGAEDRPGLFELADGGTLFLDEIHAMPIDLQAKLLRVLEDGGVRRVGGTRFHSVDVRIIVATNEDPLESIEKGRLRRDLFHRIHVVGLYLPPLRERKEDIECLTHYFFRKLKGQLPTTVEEIADEVMEAFFHYDWPGNVRELEHTLEGALNLAEGKAVKLEHLPPHMQKKQKKEMLPLPGLDGKSLREVLGELEQKMICLALEESGGNVLKAAKLLGIPRQTLQYKLKKREG
ncbi:sigma-54-dependent Fis family transcriptional regulator [Thermoactinomyces sp. CICC 10523]|uniref:sigma-54 interaction domain-containing protein n=1 Tax=Thermoactinomyces sp. CICC 10523 TaxID=2767428 RepID=UPI0018DDEE8F|nr:sigma 54-interacting transcriptional regulator [Thermoactinomyces sp. CICC 10523]MBH8597890.1 sigma 54-interacting transcriptional regulator [Thermoactinomyces sp. CICC 10523]